jgi:aryl-alcohol dehydrogenase-like predicted oxidoreductase
MIYRKLGRTGLMVSEVGFGGWAIGGEGWGHVSEEDSLAALARAHGLGVNFFDTADVYGHGHSEELIGLALGEVRERVLIATKASVDFTRGEPARHNYQPDYLREALERSLERLRTTYVDLYQLHNPPQKLARDDRVWEALAELRAEGKTRFFGISARTSNDALAYLRADREGGEPGKFGDTLQVAFNLLDQEAATKGVFEQAASQGWGVIVRSPLAAGLLSGKYSATHYFPPADWRSMWSPPKLAEYIGRVEELRQLANEGRSLTQAAIAFALSERAASTAIVGAKTPAQVEENVAAAAWVPLSGQDLRLARSRPDE